MYVGTALGCEPNNAYDGNAVRVEVYGQLVGYVRRSQAARLSSWLEERHGGALEAAAVIVGGFVADRRGQPGYYGVRLWANVPGNRVLTESATRVGTAEDRLDEWK
jgi:hypothetical protein